MTMPPLRGKKFIFSRILLAGVFSLLISFYPSTLYAQIQQWDFQIPEDYDYDPQKVLVENGMVKLIQRPPYRDEKDDAFRKGDFVSKTWSATDSLELTAPSLFEGQGPLLPSPVPDDAPGLMALWHMDEPMGSNLLDGVARNVAKASDTEIVSGQTGFGYARLFDGEKSYVFIPHYQSLDFSGPFTVEAWIRPSKTLHSKPQTVLSRWQTVGSQKGFALQIATDGKLELLASKDGATTTSVKGETVLASGLWYHVAAVLNGQDLKVFVNGVLDQEPVSFKGPVYAANNPLYLGGLVNNRVDEHYEGVIDEVAIYPRALSETEFLTHFGNLKGIVGLWNLNERGGALADRSGYGHHAKSYGNPTYEVPGKLGKAVHFNGKDQYIETPSSYRLVSSDTMTVEFWVQPDKLPGPQKAGTILSSVGGENQWSLSVLEDGRLQVFAPVLSPAEVTSRGRIGSGLWQHVSVSWGRGILRIYLNGMLDTEAPYNGFLKHENSALRIGMDAAKTTAFHGAVDEVAVYRRVKSDEEIAETAGLFPSKGIYESSVKDAGSGSPWQALRWEEAVPYGNEISGEARGLLHVYHLNEPQNNDAFLTDSKGDNHANPMRTYPVPGVFADARWFAEKGQDRIISQKPFPSLSTFTLSFWFQFASGTPGAGDRLFSIGDEKLTAFRSAGDGRIHVAMLGAKEIVGQTRVTNTRWHHFTLTSDSRRIFLYLDGDLDGDSPVIGQIANEPLVIGNLKTSDTFEGAVDEFALYNYALSDHAVFNNFLSGKTDLKFLARTSGNKNFDNIAWSGPMGRNHVERQPAASTVGLWHFNDQNLPAQAHRIMDSGANAIHGIAYGNVRSSDQGVLHGSLGFNGTSDYIEIADHPNLRRSNTFTLTAWVRPEKIHEQGARILDKRFKKGPPIFSSYSLQLLPRNRLALRLGRAGGYRVISTDNDGEIAAGRWSHLAATYDGHEVRLYINGKLKKAVQYQDIIPYDEGSLYIGRYGSGDAEYFEGQIDEVGIDSDALRYKEIQTLFMNGDPENYYRIGPREELDLPSGRYFQYQAHLSTDYPPVTPSLKQVEVEGAPFAVDQPFVMNRLSVSFADLSRFREKIGPSHYGGITYQLSNDGHNWFYHNGRHWVIASDSAESNTGEQVDQRVTSFAQDIGIGSFYFKAFLHSPSGLESVELEALEVEYLPNKMTMTSPNGGEAWLVGSDQLVLWDSAGEVDKVRLEYSKDGFKRNFNTIAESIENTGSFTWTVPDDIGIQMKVRVSDSLDPRIYDISDIAFRIVGAFEVVVPNWAERWTVGEEQVIQWRTLGTVPEVKLEYSTDNFEQAVFPIVDSVENEGEYLWQIPDHVSPNVKVRVSDLRDGLVFDQSNDTFAIVGALEMVDPAAHARWQVGTQKEITWKSTGTFPTVKLQYAQVEEGVEPEWVTIEESYPNRGIYLWEVPDAIYPNMRIRVMSAQDKKVISESPSFAIVGGFELLQPKGGEFWTVSSRRKIAWNAHGSVSFVKLEYAVIDKSTYAEIEKGIKTMDADLHWKTIEPSFPNIGNYVWNVTDDLGDRVVIRVSDAQDPFVSSIVKEPFRIIPGFILKMPNGGENWKIGSEQMVEWQTKGTMPEVKIEYSTDNFVENVREVIARASNVGRFSWLIPNDANTNVRIRISDPDFPEAYDISDLPFRIHGGFNILEPEGGEKYEVGTLAAIRWETLGKIPAVRLEYSKDDFNQDVRLIAEKIENKGVYTWTVPDDIGPEYQLRITDVRDEFAHSVFESAFAIVGTFHLIHPAGGHNYTAGTIQKIQWKGAGSIPFIRIDYSEDNFAKSYITLADQAPNNGSFDWKVPNRPGQSFHLRIWDPAEPTSMAVMDQPARIISGFVLTSPNGGEVLYVGDWFQVAWATQGTVPRVKLDFSDDLFNKNVWQITDAFENIGQYTWQIPDIISGMYRLRLSDANDSTAFDISNADFRIRSRFTIMSPNGGEGWPLGSTQHIKWRTSGSVPSVLLEYSTDDFNTVKTIATDVPNDGFYPWTIPSQVSQSVKVRISDSRDPGAVDYSDGPFRIQGIFELTSPKSREVWTVGNSHPITWNTLGDVDAVRLEYSRDGFVAEAVPIAESTPNSGYYEWVVPDALSDQAKIRILDIRDSQVQVVSEPFQIAAAIKVMEPDGGEIWHAHEKREIIWSTMGTVPEVDLSFCSFGDVMEQDRQGCPRQSEWVIDKRVLNSGRYVWDMPSHMGPHFRIKVCDSGFPDICDVTDGTFAIESPIEIIYPRGGERWPVGSDQEIRWRSFGQVEEVLVEYATADGMAYDAVSHPPLEWKRLAEELANQGRFVFRIPDRLSKNVYFRVSAWRDETLHDVTDQPIHFGGLLTLLSPNGGEKWKVGGLHEVLWESVGSVPSVRLEYSTDNFEHNIYLVESDYPNSGRYEWTIPPVRSVTMKLRIASETDDLAFDISDQPFKVMTQFEITSPNGGELWKVDQLQKMTWNSQGETKAVRLEYRPSDKESDPWRIIADKIPNTGEYSWTPPEHVSSQVWVRVVDAVDEEARDRSDESFKLLAQFRLLTPNPGEVLYVGDVKKVQWGTLGDVPEVRLEYTTEDLFSKESVSFKPIEPRWENSGTYFWTVPDEPSEKVWLRISDSREPQAFYLSEEPVKIRGRMHLMIPDGKNSWPIGSVQTIQWVSMGTIPAVRLEYLKSGDPKWKTIVDFTENTGFYGWAIPNDYAHKVQIRVSDARNPEVFDIAKNTVTLAATFKILNPHAESSWVVGSPQTIQWETTGTPSRIFIDYLSETGAGWQTIVGPIENTGSFEWLVPDSISSFVKVRIRDADNEDAFAESEPFRITGALELKKPSGNELWAVGSPQALRWITTGTIPKVRIDAVDGTTGELLFNLTESYANDDRFDWVVADRIHDNVRLRVADARDPGVFTANEEPISIIGQFEFIKPEGGERWVVGDSEDIVWNTQGGVGSVALTYSRDDFVHDVNPIASDVPNKGLFNWTVPDSIAEAMKIRISDFEDSRTFHLSRPFRVQGDLSFVVPRGGEVWTVGDQQTVSWHTTGTIPEVRLELSRDYFQKDLQIVENGIKNNESYEWIVPDWITSDAVLRVVDVRDAKVLDVSEPFKIQGDLKLLSPAGGEVFRVLATQKIAWETTGMIPWVRIEYSRDHFDRHLQDIASQAPNTGVYEWNIPDDIGRDVRIRISDVRDPSVFDMTSGPFDIIGSLSLTTNHSGKIWPVGSEQIITWQTAGTIPYVRAEYSNDHFDLDRQVIADQLPNDGRLVWRVPDDISDQILIRIVDPREERTFTLSQAPSKIIGSLKLKEWGQASKVIAGENKKIFWDTMGSIPTVRLDYAAVKGQDDPSKRDWKLIEGSIENTGIYPWKVPDDIAQEVYVRISDVRDLATRDTTNQPLEITGDLGLINPMGGERWIVGTRHDIVWRSTGTIPEVRLEYAVGPLSGDFKTIAEKITNTGRFNWTIPDQISDHVKVRIKDQRDEKVYSSSSGNFSIIGNLIFLGASDPVIWTVGEEKRLQWETLGAIRKVKLEYFVAESESTPAPRVIENQIENTGEYTWKVPDKIGSGYKVRVLDAKDPSVSAVSPYPIKVAGKFEWLEPSQPGAWTVGETKILKWKTTGTIPHVRLEYSSDGFQKDIQLIRDIVANTGEYQWTVPDDIKKDVRLRISDVRDAGIFSVSPGAVKLSGKLNWIEPNKGWSPVVGNPVRLEWETTGTIPSVKFEYSARSNDKGEPVEWRLVESALENTGTYYWKIPDDISGQVVLRISAVNDFSIVDLTERPFAIKGNLMLVEPGGDEKWVVGSEYDIIWKSIGTIPDVRLEYSRDSFFRDIQLVQDHIPNTGRFRWKVPDAISNLIKVRVVDVRDHTVQGVSSDPFTVVGGFTLETPVTPVSWKVHEEQVIEWKTLGTVPFVRLDYLVPSSSGGPVPMVIHEKFSNQGKYIWKVPDQIGQGYQIRVADANNPDVFDLSPGKVHIEGVLDWFEPAHTETWTVAEERSLRWKTTGTLPFVTLEYSTDGFQRQIYVIGDTIGNQNHFLWRVPDNLAEQVFFRVRDSKNPEVAAVSPNPIKIAGAIKMVSPRDPIQAVVGTEELIRWTTVGSIASIRLEYSTSKDAKPSHPADWKVIEGAVENTGEYRWIVPDDISGTVQLKISSVRDPEIYDVSLQSFAITGGIWLRVPEGGERWAVGDQQDLIWDFVGSIPFVTLQYSTDNFNTQVVTFAERIPNAGVHSWKIPDVISEHLRIRVMDADNPKVFAVSTKPFKVIGDFLFTAPLQGAAWTVGEEQKMTWETVGSIQDVRLEYLVTNQFGEIESRLIEERIANQGIFLWRLPDDLPPQIRLRISDANDHRVSKITDSPVKLLGALKWMAPNSEQVWTVGSVQKLVWDTKGHVPKVELQYSTDGFKQDVRPIYPAIANTGTANWEVPDLPNRSVQIRISDAVNPEVKAVTAVPVEVVGHFRLFAPRGAERWKVGSTQKIHWNTVGSIPQVSLDYSQDPYFRKKVSIADRIPNTGQFQWTVPDEIAKTVWVRISDPLNPKVAVQSEGSFTIHGGLHLTSPAGGEIFRVSDEVKITWDTVGSIPQVRLEYSVDDFLSSVPMSLPVSNAGYYLWKVPDLVSDQIRVRVLDVRDDLVFSSNSTPFKIQGAFDILHPKTREFWPVGSEQVITWETYGSLPYVNLEYSEDHFKTAKPIILGLANRDSYTWTVPDISAKEIQIRVSNAEDQSVFAITQEAVVIGGQLHLLSPVGGERFRVGEAVEIKWKTVGTIPRVRLEYSRDQFSRDIQVIEDAAANNGSYSWTLPDMIYPTYQIRITDVRNTVVTDVTDGSFKVVGGFELTSPQGGEDWVVGSTQTLQWKTLGDIPSVRLDYSTDNFTTSMPIETEVANEGSYVWAVPDLTGSHVWVRVSSVRDGTVFAASPFAVKVRGNLALTSALGGEVWQVGGREVITWRTAGTIPSVNLEYVENGNHHSMAAGIKNAGSYTWTIPDIQANHVMIRIADAANEQIHDQSREAIKIQGTVELLNPRGGELWLVGESQPIRWKASNGIQNVRIEYSDDHFRTAFPVRMSVPNTGEYVWQVADAISKNSQIRITDVQDPSAQAASKPFEIRGALHLYSPAGGELWAVGERQVISWETVGSIPQVRLEYSTDDFRSKVYPIAPALPNRGIFYWDIPVIQGRDVKVRITDTAHPEVFDQSRLPFQVGGKIDLLYPNMGEILRVGDRLDIVWKSTPNIANVKLEYSTNDFQTSELISAVLPNTGKFSWNVPNIITENLRVRISDSQNATVFAVSKIPSRVLGVLELVEPQGEVLWPAGSVQTVRWESLGTIPEVRLEYSKDNFETVLPIVAKIENTGRYDWKIPEIVNKRIQIRIVDVNNPSVSSDPSGGIRIAGSLELISPNGGERWVTSEEQVVRWKTTGHIPKVTLEYSKDQFRRDIHRIEAGVPNAGSYFWKIPNDPSTSVMLRIRDAEDESISVVSESPFQIGYYTVDWIVRDASTLKHLGGVMISDSTGKSQTGLKSPVRLEYPYGIHTTVWSKNGYREFRSTWLADQDRTFEVSLEPEFQLIEEPRVNFEYDPVRDLMKIRSWVDQNGVSLPAVMEAEIRIYDKDKLVQTLRSANPDRQGYFQMVWNTQAFRGDARYLASALITKSNGEKLTSPMSFQLYLPVKEKRQPVVPRPRTPPPSYFEPERIMTPSVVKSKKEATAPAARVVVPEKAVLNETISVTFVGTRESKPVLDIYDANQKLILWQAPMLPAETAGEFSYLLTIKGDRYTPGKSILLSVTDQSNGQTYPSSLQIESATRSLGLDRMVGSTTVMNLIRRMEDLAARIEDKINSRQNAAPDLSEFSIIIAELGTATESQMLEPGALQKINKIAETLAVILAAKGYQSEFLLKTQLGVDSSRDDVSYQLRNMQFAVSMLQKLYKLYYSGSRG